MISDSADSSGNPRTARYHGVSVPDAAHPAATRLTSLESQLESPRERGVHRCDWVKNSEKNTMYPP